MKIYTKTGDDGSTSLARGTRVMKDNSRVEAYGTIDELNSYVGLLSSFIEEPFLEEIQNKLFIVGGYLADEELVSSGITTDNISTVEAQIDFLECRLEPLHGFILPRGNYVVSLCHVCRTICRRAERRMVALRNAFGLQMDVNPFIYINRLSDYFFILGQTIK